ncbi:MAG: beta-lactamase family protein [Hyphomonadaceae bacterium]|nr:beta-lactamase family protein [Hyphomonadaceae bacterium]
MSETPISGYVAPGLEAVRDAFAANFEAGEELGAGFAAWIGDQLIVDLQGGWADKGKSQIWDTETLVPVFSTTKPISALVIARLIEQAGPDITYETPVTALWPEFAAHGKGALTIAEVLSHQGGLPGFAEEIDPELWLDPPALAARLAETPPLWPPGDGSGYHPLTWGYLAGEIARRLDTQGRSLGTVLRQEITGPNEIDFWIGLPPSEHARVAEMKRPTALPELGELNEFKRAAFMTKWSSPKRGGAIWKEIEIPSANGHGTAAATARLYSVYAGTLDIGLSETTGTALTSSRSHRQDRVLPFVIDFAAGVMRNSETVYGPNRASFGHSGWGGSLGFGDPDRGLSAAYVMNRQSNILQGDPRPLRLISALYDSL